MGSASTMQRITCLAEGHNTWPHYVLSQMPVNLGLQMNFDEKI